LFQQIVAGDSWGLVSVPVIEKRPEYTIIFICIVVSVSLGVMNLILAVIVESAAEARESDLAQKHKTQKKEAMLKKIELCEMAHSMDKDHSDTISFEEMQEAWNLNPAFQQVMGSMSIRDHDLDTIFKIMDEDNSGDVDYKEFVEKLYHLRTSDVRIDLELARYAFIQRFDTIEEKLKEQRTASNRHSQALESIDAKLALLCKSSGIVADSAPAEADTAAGGSSELRDDVMRQEPDSEPTGKGTERQGFAAGYQSPLASGTRGPSSSLLKSFVDVEVEALRGTSEELQAKLLRQMKRSIEDSRSALSRSHKAMTAYISTVPAGVMLELDRQTSVMNAGSGPTNGIVAQLLQVPQRMSGTPPSSALHTPPQPTMALEAMAVDDTSTSQGILPCCRSAPPVQKVIVR
jgi:hypothetical protein